MEELLKMYREYNDKRFDEVRDDIKDIASRIEDLREFKIQQIAAARTVSMIISSVCGFITLIVSSLLTVKFSK